MYMSRCNQGTITSYKKRICGYCLDLHVGLYVIYHFAGFAPYVVTRVSVPVSELANVAIVMMCSRRRSIFAHEVTKSK